MLQRQKINGFGLDNNLNLNNLNKNLINFNKNQTTIPLNPAIKQLKINPNFLIE